MGQREQYRVLVARMADWWCVEIPELGTFGECRHFGDAEQTARQAIATSIEAELDSFDVVVEMEPALSELFHVSR